MGNIQQVRVIFLTGLFLPFLTMTTAYASGGGGHEGPNWFDFTWRVVNFLILVGVLYWLFPRLYHTKLWSTKLANYHFWIGLLGMMFYLLPIYVSGVTQGLMWKQFTGDGFLLDLAELIGALGQRRVEVRDELVGAGDRTEGRDRTDHRAARSVDEAAAGVGDQDRQQVVDHRADDRGQIRVRGPADRDEERGEDAPRDQGGDVRHDHAGHERADALDGDARAGLARRVR